MILSTWYEFINFSRILSNEVGEYNLPRGDKDYLAVEIVPVSLIVTDIRHISTIAFA